MKPKKLKKKIYWKKKPKKYFHKKPKVTALSLAFNKALDDAIASHFKAVA